MSNDESTFEWHDFKYALLNRITSVTTTGSFATFGIVEDFVNPGVSVDSQEPIRLPLSLQDANTLIQASHRAPFGNGTQTVIDESIRKTWQIDADHVQFLNERWQSCLDRIVRKVTEELGVPDGSQHVHAEFYKLLVYETGAMFKAHKDTEKSPGMFGTLVICLPGPHEGGDIHLVHASQEMTFSSSKHSAFDATFTAWYADVSHEIEPVRSGHRWVLIYNLINTRQDLKVSAHFLHNRIDESVNLLNKWQNSEEPLEALMFRLRHQYTNESLSLKRLKGADLYRASYIAQICARHGASWALLANMKYRQIGAPKEGDQCETELFMTRITDLDGFEVSVYAQMDISAKLILGDNPYVTRDPDGEVSAHYLGDSHVEKSQFYKDSVAIIVPAKRLGSFVMGSVSPNERPNHNTIECFMAQLRPRATNYSDVLLPLCRQIIDSPSQNLEAQDLNLGSVAASAACLSNASLFKEAINRSTNSFGKATYHALGRTINLEHCPAMKDDLVRSLTKSDKLHVNLSNINSFRTGLLQENDQRESAMETKFMNIWLDSLVYTCLDQAKEASMTDGTPLIDVVIQCEGPSFKTAMLCQGVYKFVHRFLDCVPLLTSSIIEILLQSETSVGPTAHVSCLLSDLLTPFVSAFDLGLYALCIENHAEKKKTTGMTTKIIGRLYNAVSARDPDLLVVLLARIQNQAFELTPRDYESFVPEMVPGLLEVLELPSRPARNCVHALITAYLFNIVGPEPERPKDWSREDEITRFHTGCQHCQQINDFLRNPEEEEYRMAPSHDRHYNWYFPSLEFGPLMAEGYIRVKKTLKGWTQQHEAWDRRVRSSALVWSQTLSNDKLKQCLGELYGDILELKAIRVD